MRQTRRAFVLFSFYDRTGIREYLERQAAQGWMLEKTSALGWVFRRIEPQRVHFAVTYFPQASVFDPEPSEEQQLFRDFCAHTGWRLVAANAQMQIFCNEGADPVPIETDAVLEVETIHKAMKKFFLPNYLLMLLMDILVLALWVWRLGQDPIGVLSNQAELFTGLFWGMGMLLMLVDVGGYMGWYRRARAAAELDGSFVPTRAYRGFKLVWLVFLLVAFICMLVSVGWQMAWIAPLTIAVILAITGIVVGISELLKRCKVRANVNRGVTIVLTAVLSFGVAGIALILIVSGIHAGWSTKDAAGNYEVAGHTFYIYADELPLTVENLLPVEYDGYSYELRSYESLLLGRHNAYQRGRLDGPDMPQLDYTVVEVKLPSLYALCREEMLNDIVANYGLAEGDDLWQSYNEVDAVPWGAAAAYQVSMGTGELERYLLCYERCIVEIRFDWQVTEEQKAVVGEKFGSK